MRKIMKNIVFAILLLFSLVSASLLVCVHFAASAEQNLSGRWTARLDLTQQAAVRAYSWLQDIEAVAVALEDMDSYMQNLTVEIDLILEQTARSEGTFQGNVLPESYDACNQAAYEAFAAVFQDLLAERLRMAGYTGDTGREAIDALVTETFGTSTVSYLMSCAPSLLPPLEDLQAWYGGSGTYKAAENVLTRQFEAGQAVSTRTEHYIRKDSSLVLSGESDSDSVHYPLVYTLRQGGDAK